MPLFPEVRRELLALAASNPRGRGEDASVFHGTDPARPMQADILRAGPDAALAALTLGDPEDRNDAAKVHGALAGWKARGIRVHSWRHFYASRMSDVADERVVRLATGHASALMHQHYSSNRTESRLRQAADAAVAVFQKVVPTEERAAVS